MTTLIQSTPMPALNARHSNPAPMRAAKWAEVIKAIIAARLGLPIILPEDDEGWCL